MFRFLLFGLLIFSTLKVQGQLAIINDPDNFTNVRKDKSVTSKVVGRLYKDDVFLYSFDKEDDQWVGIFYTKADSSYIQGFIHKSRLLPIAELEHISWKRKSRTEKTKELLIQNDSMQVVVKTESFISAKHKIERDKEGYVIRIDGKQPKGTDGNLPKIGLTYISVKVNGKDVFIPAGTYKDLFEPEIKSFNVYFDKKGIIYLYMPFNSDGAGGYFVAWTIKNGKYSKRYVDSP